MHTNFDLIAKDNALSGEHLDEDRKKIVKQFLKVIPNYGTVVLRRDKEAFEKQIEGLRNAVEVFRKSLIERVRAAIEQNRLALMAELLPKVVADPPQEWRTSFQKTLGEDTIKRMLDDELQAAFDKAELLVSGMRVSCLFKGVTYELLQNKTFLNAARKVLPELPVLHEEYDAARAAKTTG